MIALNSEFHVYYSPDKFSHAVNSGIINEKEINEWAQDKTPLKTFQQISNDYNEKNIRKLCYPAMIVFMQLLLILHQFDYKALKSVFRNMELLDSQKVLSVIWLGDCP